MRIKTGAEYLGDKKTKFVVWAPFKENVQLVLKDKDEPLDLEKKEGGYWEAEVENTGPGTLYKFRLDNENEFPDPASRSQPEGVHLWSRVIEKEFDWSENNWKGLPISKMTIYELHVGTFTPQGTFEAIIEKLDHLLELGVNTIEIMPISQFPGNRNWGYDGVYPYAAQESYGGANGLKKLVNACHQKGIAVILDAVYNHMGPEGNYLSQYGPYFTEKYQTPWGAALNFDDKHSDEVRNFFLQNALMWLDEFKIDGLRLDAVHEIIDRGAKHLLKELSQRLDELEKSTGREYVLIAESDLNDIKVINTYEKGGFGLEGQWVDDFHHALHTLLTGENQGYYKDYGRISHIEKAYSQAFIYDGIYSDFRKRTVGNSPKGLPASQFVVCIQNHDQIGNRMLGDRLTETLSFEALKLAAGVVISSPFVPMLYMGEEFAEDNPFQYFVSHGDPDLVKAVQQGRKREFEYFFDNNTGEFPDPQSEETFERSKLNWNFKEDPKKKTMFEFYKHLFSLRNAGAFDALRTTTPQTTSNEEQRLLTVFAGEKGLYGAFNFGEKPQQLEIPQGNRELLVASGDVKWNGSINFSEESNNGKNVTLPGWSFIFYKIQK